MRAPQPKSISFTSMVSWFTRRFSGLMSRWKTPLSQQTLAARTTCHITCRAVPSSRVPPWSSMKLSKSMQGKGRSMTIVVVCLFLPVQQFNYLRSAGALIGHECQANLQGEAFGMTRLKEKTWSFDGGSFPNKDFKTADKSFAVCD